jgi:hypothetical protein
LLIFVSSHNCEHDDVDGSVRSERRVRPGYHSEELDRNRVYRAPHTGTTASSSSGRRDDDDDDDDDDENEDENGERKKKKSNNDDESDDDDDDNDNDDDETEIAHAIAAVESMNVDQDDDNKRSSRRRGHGHGGGGARSLASLAASVEESAPSTTTAPNATAAGTTPIITPTGVATDHGRDLNSHYGAERWVWEPLVEQLHKFVVSPRRELTMPPNCTSFERRYPFHPPFAIRVCDEPTRI